MVLNGKENRLRRIQLRARQHGARGMRRGSERSYTAAASDEVRDERRASEVFMADAVSGVDISELLAREDERQFAEEVRHASEERRVETEQLRESAEKRREYFEEQHAQAE